MDVDTQALKKLIHECLNEDKFPTDMLRKHDRDTTEARNLAAGAFGIAAAPSAFDLEHLFKYHPPDLDQMGKYTLIRNTAKFFAQVILDNTPPGADQSAAIRHIRDAVMTANAAIALRGRT